MRRDNGYGRLYRAISVQKMQLIFIRTTDIRNRKNFQLSDNVVFGTGNEKLDTSFPDTIKTGYHKKVKHIDYEIYIYLKPLVPGQRRRPVLGPIDINTSDLFLLPAEPPALRFPQINLTPDVARITLNEHDVSVDKVEAMMQATDLFNFGIMTAEDWKSLSAREWSFMESIQDTTATGPTRLPTRDITVMEDEFTASENGLQEAPAQEEHESLPVAPTPILAPHEIWPSTPTKHKAPTSPDIETPSKRQRMLEPEIMAEVSRQEIDPLHNTTNGSDFVLSSIDDRFVKPPKPQRKKRTRKFMDVQMIIPYDASATHTRVSTAFDDIIELPIGLSATELLQRPSTKLKLGNKELLAHFQMMILEPISQRISPEKTRFRSLIGSSTGNTTDLSNAERTKGISSKDASNENASSIEAISKTDTLLLPPSSSIDLHPTTTAMQSEFEIPDLEPELPLQQETMPSPLPRLPTAIKDLASEWLDTSQTAHHPRMPKIKKFPSRESHSKAQQIGDKRPGERDVIDVAKSVSPECPSRVDWSKADISAIIDSLLSEQDYIRFSDVCSPASLTRYEAAPFFVICLQLHQEKKICLTQARGSFSPIFIQRYYPD